MSEDPTENNQTFGLDEDAKRRGVIEALIIAAAATVSSTEP